MWIYLYWLYTHSWPVVIQSALQTFGKINSNNLPQRIVFFRDGVSEGEFAIVRDRELNAMKGTFHILLTSTIF